MKLSELLKASTPELGEAIKSIETANNIALISAEGGARIISEEMSKAVLTVLERLDLIDDMLDEVLYGVIESMSDTLKSTNRPEVKLMEMIRRHTKTASDSISELEYYLAAVNEITNRFFSPDEK